MSATATLEVRSPFTGDLVGEAPVSTPSQVTAALDAGARAGALLPRHERARVLFAVLQCAALAREHCAAEFVVAALLHDIARAPAVAGVAFDRPGEHHGEAAARSLTPRLGRRVVWLAEQHVAAQRYLVATDPGYAAKRTDVSARTLRAQGGPMTSAEIDAFRSPRLAPGRGAAPDR